MAVFGVVAFFGYILLFALAQSYIGHRVGAVNLRARESPARLVLIVVCLLLFTLALKGMKDQRPHPALIAIGMALVAAGLVLSMWAQVALGKYWVGGVGLHKKHVLLTSGPYHYVRHPMYSGILLSTLGLGLAGWNILYLLSMLCWSGGFLFRAFGEDYTLAHRFGDSYAAYANKTGMIFPRFRK